MMKPKQFYSKREYRRCSLCDAILKSSPSHRYVLMGKSMQETLKGHNHSSITYAECCAKYLHDIDCVNQLTMICLKCSEYLQRIHSWHLDAQSLARQMCQTFAKTKRLKRLRTSPTGGVALIDIKQEQSNIPKATEFVRSKEKHSICISSTNSPFVPVESSTVNVAYNDSRSNSPISYTQFLIDPTMEEATHVDQDIITLDDDQSPSPSEIGSKTTRLSRRRYEFLVTLPSQQSLNAFIESSASQSNSRWTWRRTSANSRGYKIYYVCNFSMRRHYHPCPAAMYALFNPEGTISIYSHGQHEHIPKDHVPSTITDQTKEEIFKCLQSDMSVPDIREHLIRHQLPFGDTKKLNNFIKYHKEILRYGSVTNLRLTGTAYRQPQFWTIRHPNVAPPPTPTHGNPTILQRD